MSAVDLPRSSLPHGTSRLGNTYILVLEQLGNAKEQGRGLLCRERLSDIQQVHDPGQQRSALPG
jgi:hypothetical protein